MATTQAIYQGPYDPILGYARGVILKDDIAEYRVTLAAEDVLLDRYNKRGIDGLHNLMGLVDNCRLPDFFAGPAYQERFLAIKLMESRLTELARDHMGGDEQYRAMAFNRVTAGVTSLILALVPSASFVAYVVPPYPGLTAHGHPCTPRAVHLAGARHETISSVEELTGVFRRERDVSLVAVCGSYRGIVRDDVLSQVCHMAHDRGIPVFVDDASGARNRVVSMGQTRAVDLGADLVFTSCEKAGLYGPRAGVLIGRKELMLKVGAKAASTGSEARPSVVAAIIRSLEEYTPEKCKEMFAQWSVRHQHICEILAPVMGKGLGYDSYNGVYMGLEAFAKLVKERAGLDKLDLAPIDLSAAHSMLMLRHHGFMTIAALHYAGASKLMNVKVNALRSPNLTDEDIGSGILDSLNELSRIAGDPAKVEGVLFGS